MRMILKNDTVFDNIMVRKVIALFIMPRGSFHLTLHYRNRKVSYTGEEGDVLHRQDMFREKVTTHAESQVLRKATFLNFWVT